MPIHPDQMVRRRQGRAFGHSTVRAQLEWCVAEGLGTAILTHCGSVVDGGDGRKLNALLRAMATEQSVTARFARDRLAIRL